jgi:hypothetical protein
MAILSKLLTMIGARNLYAPQRNTNTPDTTRAAAMPSRTVTSWIPLRLFLPEKTWRSVVGSKPAQPLTSLKASCACGESKSEQRLGLTEDAMKHRLRQLTGKGILLARVIGTDQSKFIRQNARDPVSELRPRPWNCLTGFFKGL